MMSIIDFMHYEVIACRKFCWAILERAILDIVCIRGVERHHKQAARTWMLQNYVEPFSYRWICEILDLDAKVLRRKILRLRPQQLLPSAKSAVFNFIHQEPTYFDAIEVHTYHAKVLVS